MVRRMRVRRQESKVEGEIDINEMKVFCAQFLFSLGRILLILKRTLQRALFESIYIYSIV